MAESLYKVLFVGFPEPDRASERGNVTIQRLMDITGVPGKNIIFLLHEVDENTLIKPHDIITENFNYDASQKETGGYNIGFSVCVSADTLSSTQESKLRTLSGIPGMFIRTGYRHVDLDTLTETQLNEWFNTGNFTETVEPQKEQKNNDSSTAEDILNNVISGGTTTNPITIEQPHDVTPQAKTMKNIAEDDDVTPYDVPISDSDEDDGDDIISQIVGMSDETEDDTYAHTSPDASEDTDDIDDILNLFSNSGEDAAPDTVPSVGEDTTTHEDATGDDGDDILSMLYGDDDTGGETGQENIESTPDASTIGYDTHTPNNSSDATGTGSTLVSDDTPDIRSSSPHRDSGNGEKTVDSSGDSFADRQASIEEMIRKAREAKEDAEKNQNVGSNENKAVDNDHGDSFPPTSQNQSSDTGSTSYTGAQPEMVPESPEQDDYVPTGDYIGAAYEQRKGESQKEKIIRGREEKRKREEERRAGKSHEVSGLDTGNQGDILDRISQLSEKTSNAVSGSYHDDGTPRTYKDYLSPTQVTEQNVIEKGNRDFGTQLNNAHMSRSSGGKIIMVTSGKGGVGKTMVAAGLASSIALSKAKDMATGRVNRTSNTWLIESDYTSPQMSVAFRTGDKHLGHLADHLADRNRTHKATDSAAIRQLIEENIHIDKETGLRVIACPTIVNSNVDVEHIPLAILMAVQYANSLGDDVIIDHGNLTRAEYSDLDKVLATELAHYVLIVTTAGSSTTAWSVAKMLTQGAGSSIRKLRLEQVMIVLNKVTRQQADFVSQSLRPYIIGMTIPPINALREENTRDGDVSLHSMPVNVQKAIINRCGLMLVNKLGYAQYGRYFSTKNIVGSRPQSKKPKNKTFFQKVADLFDRGE